MKHFIEAEPQKGDLPQTFRIVTDVKLSPMHRHFEVVAQRVPADEAPKIARRLTWETRGHHAG